MLAHARHEFWLNSTDRQGVTVSDHYLQLGREADLEGPDFPDVVGYLWDYFMELHAARPVGAMGAGPLTFEGIKAWSDLTHRELSPWEVKALKDIDAIWLETQADNRR